MMFYAKYTAPDGEEKCGLYYGSAGRAQFREDTFRAGLTEIIPFCVSGKSYTERRECVRATATRFSSEAAPGLSWSEISSICAWFEKQGRQYGLLREFRENGIC